MVEEITEVEEVEVVEQVEADPDADLTPAEKARKANGFTPQEAAKELGGEDAGWSGKRLRRYIRAGICPAGKVGGRWYVTVEELETMLEKLEAKKAAKAAKEAEEQAKKEAAAQEVEEIEEL